jgi:large subunit ribosomal protein L5
MSTENQMRKIGIEKITLNIGAGKNEALIEKGIKLFEKLSPLKAVKTVTKKRIPGWGLRPGLTIGCKVTIRDGTIDLLKRLLAARDNILSPKCFDRNGNFSFGIPEYIDIEGLDYDADLKIMGLEVAVTLTRPGYRVKRRKLLTREVGKNHKITKEDAIKYVESLGVEVKEE